MYLQVQWCCWQGLLWYWYVVYYMVVGIEQVQLEYVVVFGLGDVIELYVVVVGYFCVIDYVVGGVEQFCFCFGNVVCLCLYFEVCVGCIVGWWL